MFYLPKEINFVRPSMLDFQLFSSSIRVKDKFHLCLPNKYFMTQFFKANMDKWLLDRIVFSSSLVSYSLSPSPSAGKKCTFEQTVSTRNEKTGKERETCDDRCCCILNKCKQLWIYLMGVGAESASLSFGVEFLCATEILGGSLLSLWRLYVSNSLLNTGQQVLSKISKWDWISVLFQNSDRLAFYSNALKKVARYEFLSNSPQN